MDNINRIVNRSAQGALLVFLLAGLVYMAERLPLRGQ
mgnify:CR=1 FL=1